MSPHNRVTLSEIAEQSGVSVSTVSLVLRDKPGVGTVTRQRVLGIAKELGYLPKNGLQHRPNLTNVGLILKSEPGRTPQTNQFYSHVLVGIEMACRQWQFNLLYAILSG
jgi:LacI family transcriptional regulator